MIVWVSAQALSSSVRLYSSEIALADREYLAAASLRARLCSQCCPDTLKSYINNTFWMRGVIYMEVNKLSKLEPILNNQVNYELQRARSVWERRCFGEII